MKIIKRVPVPTGDIVVVEGENGLLEFVSLGDYGKEINLNAGKSVEDNLPLLPLSEKWVLTVSTQYGCSMGCRFCDVPMVGPGTNATTKDLEDQISTGLSLHSDVTSSDRLNIHYARMGEPTWNPSVLEHAQSMIHNPTLKGFTVHPVVSTMMPRNNKWLKFFIGTWMNIKNRNYMGDAGLQISANSTDEFERATMFNGNSMTLEEISKVMENIIPLGRKITLNFAVANWQIDPKKLLRYFRPSRYIIKLTPIHKTVNAESNRIQTEGDYTQPYAYEHHKKALEDAGYEVLVFIASADEDRGMITCGNAILSGRMPLRIRTGELKFRERK